MGVLALLLSGPQGASFVYFCLEMGFTNARLVCLSV